MANTGRPLARVAAALIFVLVERPSGADVESIVGLSVTHLACQGVANRSDPTDPHVRSERSEMVAVIDDGMRRSTTFTSTVAALNASDVVAYVEPRLQMRTGFDGYLLHRVTRAGDRRYLQIFVNPGLERNRLIGVIAHELHHAVEVAQATGADSDDTIRTLFMGLDAGRCRVRCADTDAALRVQNRVLQELRTNC